jgi:hypothetical protein
MYHVINIMVNRTLDHEKLYVAIYVSMKKICLRIVSSVNDMTACSKGIIIK